MPVGFDSCNPQQLISLERRRMRSNTYRSRISCSTVRGQRRHQRSGDVDMAPWCRWSFRQSSDTHTCHTGQRIRRCSGDIPSQTTFQIRCYIVKTVLQMLVVVYLRDVFVGQHNKRNYMSYNLDWDSDMTIKHHHRL